MNRKITGITAFLTAITCIASLASCGTDVPQAENSDVSGGEFSISEGIVGDENADGQPTESEPADATTDPENNSTESTSATTGTGTDSTSTATETTAASYSIQTRDPASIPSTKKPVSTTIAPASTTRAVVVAPPPSSTLPVSTSTNTTTNAVPVISGSENPVTSGNESYTTTTAVTTAGLSGITLSYYTAEVSAGKTLKYPVVAENIQEIWTSSDESVATVDGDGNITGVGAGTCVIKVVSAYDNTMGAEVVVTVKDSTPSAGIQQIDGITYVDGILIANKTYALPSDYDPQGLTDETYTAFQELSAGAAYDGLNIYISSGYRSYSYQDEIYNNYVYWYGQDTADTFSARPGHSEHQTGLAIDVNIIDDSFIGTPEAIWLEEHCTEYGFIIRYPQGKQSITGYKYEPWHIRYVGKETAQALKNAAESSGDPYLTLEEYLGITSSYQE